MKKKRLAFVLPDLTIGGAQRVVSTLANEFCKKYEVIIITLVDGNSFYYLHHNVKHISCINKPFLNSKNIFQAIRNNSRLLIKLKHILKENDIELCIGFTTTTNILSIIASNINKIPCVISERSNPNIYTPNKFWKFLRKKTYKKANFIVVQTQLALSYFESFTIREKLIILPNPMSRELLNYKNRNTIKENIILSVGRLDKNKAQDLLIRAFNGINTDGWRLVFTGEGEEKQNYINLAKNLGIDSKISFVGKIANIFDYYNSSKIFAFTSQSEGFPNALIEAMNFELPCISTNCPCGPSEIISDGINGFLIPVNDQTALENKLTLLMSSEDLRKKIGENAFHSIKRYKTEKVVEDWDKIINKLIQ